MDAQAPAEADPPAVATADPAPDLLASRRWAIGGFLALATALLLPWWSVTWDDGQVAVRDSVRAFRPEPPLTTTWGPWLTGALAAAALLVLFVRIAARSERHEPPSWRRDVGIAAGLCVAAAASTLLWPAAVPSFWGGRTYEAENVTTAVTETAMPMLGWWLALLASVLLACAVASARRRLAEAA